MEILEKMIDFDFGYKIMKTLFEEGEITFAELCDYIRNRTIPEKLINMETKEVKIEIPDGYEIDESKSSFEKIVFKKKEKFLPKSWKEFARLQENDTFHLGCEIINYNGFSSVFVSDKYAAAIAALNKLIRLRDYYNEGWKPNWENQYETKYVITTYCNALSFRYDDCKNVILAFKSNELREEFYNNFKDLIEQVKELI